MLITLKSTLEEVSFGECNDEDLKALVAYLPRMFGLNNLSFSHYPEEVKSELTELSFVKALERNTSLESISLPYQPTGVTNETRVRVSYLLMLNRGGRMVLASEPDVPRKCIGSVFWQTRPTIEMLSTSSFGRSPTFSSCSCPLGSKRCLSFKYYLVFTFKHSILQFTKT